MNPLSNPLDGLSPDLYVATLSKIAHADGLHPAERELLDHHAAHFGVDLDNLPVVPDDLSALPWVTRVLVYRDAVTLALVDDEMSAEERQYLDDLAGRMALPMATAEAISSWVRDYATLLERLDKLISVSRRLIQVPIDSRPAASCSVVSAKRIWEAMGDEPRRFA